MLVASGAGSGFEGLRFKVLRDWDFKVEDSGFRVWFGPGVVSACGLDYILVYYGGF